MKGRQDFIEELLNAVELYMVGHIKDVALYRHLVKPESQEIVNDYHAEINMGNFVDSRYSADLKTSLERLRMTLMEANQFDANMHHLMGDNTALSVGKYLEDSVEFLRKEIKSKIPANSVDFIRFQICNNLYIDDYIGMLSDYKIGKYGLINHEDVLMYVDNNCQPKFYIKHYQDKFVLVYPADQEDADVINFIKQYNQDITNEKNNISDHIANITNVDFSDIDSKSGGSTGGESSSSQDHTSLHWRYYVQERQQGHSENNE